MSAAAPATRRCRAGGSRPKRHEIPAFAGRTDKAAALRAGDISEGRSP
jgi:hypothetical protein